MNYWPKYKETITSKYPPEEIIRRLRITVKPVKRQSYNLVKLEGPEVDVFFFNGLVTDRGFSISKVVERPDNFLPLINGKIGVNEFGSHIEIEYSLFKSVNWFFGFWFFLLLVLTYIAFIQKQGFFWLALPVIIQFCSYAIVVSRFKKAVKESRKELLKIIC